MKKDAPYSLFGAKRGTSGDVVIMGFPFGGGTRNPSGCHAAPSTLRYDSVALEQCKGSVFNSKTWSKALHSVHVTDLGDLPYANHQSRMDYLQLAQAAAESLFLERKFPLSLGGDHLMSLPLVRAACEVYGSVQVVQLDAHSDYSPLEPQHLPCHASFVHSLIQEPRVLQVIQIGVRALQSTGPDLPPNLIQVDTKELARHLKPDVPVYLTIDTDAFDPSIAPGVGHPEPRGLQWEDWSAILEQLGEVDLIGADWMEYAPQFDTRHRLTAIGIIKALAELSELAGAAVRRRLSQAQPSQGEA